MSMNEHVCVMGTVRLAVFDFCFYLLGIFHLSFQPKVMFTFSCKKAREKKILFFNPICYSVYFNDELNKFRTLILTDIMENHALIFVVFGAFLVFLCLMSVVI